VVGTRLVVVETELGTLVVVVVVVGDAVEPDEQAAAIENKRAAMAVGFFNGPP
jgi:hypothetical protein